MRKASSILLLTAAFMMGTASLASAQTLRIGLQEDPDVLDPDRARTYVGRIVFASLCDKLVDITPDLDFAPQLATEWSFSEDNKTLTFKLREGVTFHDGEPFNAEAVKFNIERSQTLEGSLRKSELTSVESVEVVDDLTVALKLTQPDATLLAQLSDRAGMMVSPKAGEDFGTNPVCSGPFKFVDRVQNDRITLEKFAEHWDAASYNFEQVVFLPIPDTTVRLANLRSGDLQLIERLAATDIASAESDPALAVTSVVGLGYQGIRLNVNNGPRSEPLKDKRIRKALDLSIDRDAINQVVFEGRFPPSGQPFPPNSPYYDKEYGVPARDVEQAKALLKEAGVERVQLELQFANNNVQQQVNQLVQAMAGEVGFDLSLRATEFAAMQKEMQAGNFQATQIGWSGRVDPDGNIHQFATCEGTLNDGKYCNEEVDRLLNEAREVTDVEGRKALYDQAQKILYDEVPNLYLYYEARYFASTKDLSGFEPYPDGMIRLKGVKLGG